MKRMMLNLLGALVLCLALDLSLSRVSAQGAFLTVTNPALGGVGFGRSVTAVGNDRMLIGAPLGSTIATESGSAYLLSTDGVLITTFTNPLGYYGFGSSGATVGSDRVLIGGSSGAAYLFGTNGALLVTYTNLMPSAQDQFGSSVASVGSDRVLIGASDYANGAVYLFGTNGALLTTFTNPAPGIGDGFGGSVAAIGSDRVLIGAYGDDVGVSDAGAVYLFSTNGELLTTFTNPTPASTDLFGYSVAVVGNNRVLIGAPYDNMGIGFEGIAYLFNTNGTLLTTFTNPAPAYGDLFGYSLAAVGDDQVLIGAPAGNVGGSAVGAAYLFSTNGVLLTTFNSPGPVDYDAFGVSVAAAGIGQVLIGASCDDTGAIDAGVAYLFSITPSLSIRLIATSKVAISWPSPWNGWTLQENTNGVSAVNWSNAPGLIQDDGTNKTLIVNPPTGNRFYRLFKP
jgi:hypothetical protein